MSQEFHSYSLRFFDDDMEAAYANHSRKRRLNFFKLICAFGLFIQGTYILKELLFDSSTGLVIRLFGYYPLFISTLIIAYYVGLRKYRKFHLTLVAFTVFVAFLLFYLHIMVFPTKSVELADGLPLLIYGLFIFSGLWIRQLYIIGLSSYALSMCVIFYFMPDKGQLVNLAIITSFHYLMASMAKYNAEKSYRLGFLEKEKLREHEVLTQQLNQELFYQKRLYEGIVDNSSDIIGIMNTDWTMDFISNSSSKLLGEEEVQLGRKGIDLVFDSDTKKVNETFKHAMSTGESVQCEFRIKQFNGQPNWVHTIVNPIVDGTGNVSKLMIYARDISGKKEEELNLIESRNRLEDLNAQKNRFFSILSHDLKGTIGTLASMLQYLRSQFPSLNEEELKEFITNIDSSAQKSYKFLEDMLAWAKTQMSTTKLDKLSFSLNASVTEAMDPLLGMMNDKNIVLSTDIPEETEVFADRNMITTAIRNVISNAIKFSHEQGVIKISMPNQGKYTTLLVEDQGVGIEHERINNLFRIDQFQSTPGTKNERGTGLGLILCRDLIETNGGSISVDSELDVGTTVTIRVPSSIPKK
jgi:PAS domain S-box-containing protein